MKTDDIEYNESILFEFKGETGFGVDAKHTKHIKVDINNTDEIELDDLGEHFLNFLNDIGYTYVDGIMIQKSNGEILEIYGV